MFEHLLLNEISEPLAQINAQSLLKRDESVIECSVT
jgi:hypothetical protein